MEYTKKKFSLTYGGKKYTDNWDKAFGKDVEQTKEQVKNQGTYKIYIIDLCLGDDILDGEFDNLEDALGDLSVINRLWVS